MSQYDVSIITTIYNKEDFLPYTIQSLLAQQEDNSLKIEFIFIDDASTDKSLEVVKHHTKGRNNIVIIKNLTNKGPSIRTNQAVQQAHGKYIHIIDGDDIMPKNCSQLLYRLLEENKADFIYGKFKKSSLSPAELLGNNIKNEKINYNISTNPLKYIMKGGFIRMALMVKKETFLKANGCDEKIFIQDESLPLRIAACANKFIDLHNTVIYVPKLTEHNLSSNKSQQHHDRFFAYYNFWQEHLPQAKKIEHEIYKKLVACYWKYTRDTKRLPYFSRAFLYYVFSKVLNPKFNQTVIDYIAKQFSCIPNVRRIV